MSNAKRTVQAEDLYQVQIISGTRISPDGKQVIFSQHWIEQKTEKKYANLWMVSYPSGESNQITFGKQVDTSPIWSPDGNQIAFLSNRANADKPPQLYILPMVGGDARPIQEIAGSISDFAWSPDGSQIVCCVQKLDQEVLDRENDEQKKKLGVVYRHVKRFFYKLDGVGYLPQERTHLWVFNVKTGEACQITDHEIFDEQNPSWSPDGKKIIFISNRSVDPDRYPSRVDLYTISPEGGEIELFPTPVGPKSHPIFSPDGNWVAFFGQEGESCDYKNTGLWVAPTDQSQPAVNLTESYDYHVDAWTINDIGQAELMPPTWSNDSQSLYFPITRHGSTTLHKISRDGKSIQTVIGEGGVVGSFTFDQNQDVMAYFYATMQDPGQIHGLDLHTNKSCQLTEINKDYFSDLDLGHFEEIWYKGPDQNDLQGWILYPPAFDPAQKYPSILEIHGGPMTQYGFNFMHEFYYLAAQGYIVHFTNPRGGRGYGEEHTYAIWNDWGNADYRDLMAWTDLIETKDFIDPDRMGVCGGSYGGYMSVWIIGHTQRFKAAVPMRCVSNLISLWGSSDMNWGFQEIFGNKMPFESLENYWDHSPMKYIGNARTPTLVIHNEMDLRCPIEQGEQVFVALKMQGVDTEMIRFPDEFHGLSRNGRTDRRIVRLQQIVRWFDCYLKI